MGDVFSSLRKFCTCCCIGRDDDDSTLPYIPLTYHEEVFDMSKLKYSTLDNYEYQTPVKYYVLMNGKRIDMI